MLLRLRREIISKAPPSTARPSAAESRHPDDPPVLGSGVPGSETGDAAVVVLLVVVGSTVVGDEVVVVAAGRPPTMTIGTVLVSLSGADSQGFDTLAWNELTDGVSEATKVKDTITGG